VGLGRRAASGVWFGRLGPSTQRRARLAVVLGALPPVLSVARADEARNCRLPRARGVVGCISPVSAPYCADCNRMRLTADGRFHLCLLNDDELDVRGTLRAGGGPEAVTDILMRAVRFKPTGHRLDLGRSTAPRDVSP